MKIGLLTGVLGDRDRRSAFAHTKALGFDAVELGTGEFTTDVHAGLESLSNDPGAVASLERDLQEAGLELSALSCHNNALHPDDEYASRADRVFRDTVKVASRLGVKNVVVFSGCPGEPGGNYPNWVTTPWPDYFDDLLEWQWTEKLIPYWSDAATFASEQGVRIAIEMHPGMSVYNLPTLLRLRDACGAAIGANYDPSHLWWQGMDRSVNGLLQVMVFCDFLRSSPVGKLSEAKGDLPHVRPVFSLYQRQSKKRKSAYLLPQS